MSNCVPITTTPGSPTASPTSEYLGWVSTLDFGTPPSVTSDATTWLQEAINSVVATSGALYLLPRPYLITSGLVATGPCTLLGLQPFGRPTTVDSFTQDASGNVTGCGTASIVTTDGGLEMLCIVGSNVVIENLNFITIPGTGSGGKAIHLQNNSNVRLENVGIFGTQNGILIDSASDISIKNSLIAPVACPTGGPQYGIKADSLTSLSDSKPPASGAFLQNCVVDETMYPFKSGSNQPHNTDAFIIDNGYQRMDCLSCDARAALHGFHSQNVSGSTYGANVNGFRVSFGRAYDCLVGVRLTDGQMAMVQDSLVLLDTRSGIAPSGSPNRGIFVEPGYSSGPIALSNNVVMGNCAGPSGMIGLDIEGAEVVTIAGGAILNCGASGTTALGSGTGLLLSTPASGCHAIDGLLITNCTSAGIHIASSHRGTAALVGINAAGNRSGVSGTPSYGLLVDGSTGTPVGSFVIDGCNFTNNDVPVQNASNTVGSGATALRRTVNNIGYNPLLTGAGAPSVTGTEFNNTGVDQFVYVAVSAGGSGTASLTYGSGTTTGLGTLPGIFFVPNTAGITLAPNVGTTPSWEWIGN